MEVILSAIFGALVFIGIQLTKLVEVLSGDDES